MRHDRPATTGVGQLRPFAIPRRDCALCSLQVCSHCMSCSFIGYVLLRLALSGRRRRVQRSCLRARFVLRSPAAQGRSAPETSSSLWHSGVPLGYQRESKLQCYERKVMHWVSSEKRDHRSRHLHSSSRRHRRCDLQRKALVVCDLARYQSYTHPLLCSMNSVQACLRAMLGLNSATVNDSLVKGSVGLRFKCSMIVARS